MGNFIFTENINTKTIYIYVIHVQYRVNWKTVCPVPQKSKAVCALTLHSLRVTICYH